MIQQHPRPRTPLAVDELVLRELVKPDTVPGYDTLLAFCDTQENNLFAGKVFFKVRDIIIPVFRKQVHRRRMALILLQGKDTPHTPDVGGMKFYFLLLEKIGKIIDQRIVAPGDKERLFCLGMGDRECGCHLTSRFAAF
jgi:hypothetical protein